MCWMKMGTAGTSVPEGMDAHTLLPFPGKSKPFPGAGPLPGNPSQSLLAGAQSFPDIT